MPTVTLTNTDPGPRGVISTDGLVMLAPGESRSLSLSTAEAGDLPAYFSAGDVTEGKAADGDGLDDLKVAELDKIIADESVTVPETGTGKDGRVVAADKVAAIRAHRSGDAPVADELDDMDDETLRATVQAITGAEAPADADRTALLALARG